MAATLVAIQTAWNCRWVRFGYRPIGTPEHIRLAEQWRCVRPPSVPRDVTEEECARCEFWEADDDEAES
jgi:hypothetical protein